MRLSILIPTLPKRKPLFDRLVTSLESQGGDVEILYNEYIDLSIGEKRNMLIEFAKGKYVAFVDDDDRVVVDYISLLMEGINKNVDCCSLKGIITTNGANPRVFEHSIKYIAWKTNPDADPIKYERYPNHLNCIKRSIAKQFEFPFVNHGEDKDWSTQIHESGLLKTEHYIDQIIYYYDFKTNK